LHPPQPAARARSGSEADWQVNLPVAVGGMRREDTLPRSNPAGRRNPAEVGRLQSDLLSTAM